MSAVTLEKASQLDQLKQFTKVFADTGDLESARVYQPEDATANPGLLIDAVQNPQYSFLLEKAIASLEGSSLSETAKIGAIVDRLLVFFGTDILQIVPGRVSTEMDARLSFDIAGSINKGRQLIALYEEERIPRERVLIKIASTWEGIKAAEQLQKESINCNLTLLFSFPQAVACAEAGVKLISPQVGRIYDWYKANTGKDYQDAADPGVQSVTRIYNYYKKFDYQTEIMGAGFLNTNQIVYLAGCDLLMISPHLLEELSKDFEPVTRKLSLEIAKASESAKITLVEETFRLEFNEDPMAANKTAEGIRELSTEIVNLEKLIASRI
jgi:transaldolase